MPLNFVVVGGGPTGVELAGTLGEIARMSLDDEFRHSIHKDTHPSGGGGPSVLSSFPPDLQQSAIRQLRKLVVDVRVNAMVTEVREGEIRIVQKSCPPR